MSRRRKTEEEEEEEETKDLLPDNSDDVDVPRKGRRVKGDASLLFLLVCSAFLLVLSLSGGVSFFGKRVKREMFRMQHPNERVQTYFDKLESFYGGYDNLPTCYAEQVDNNGWQQKSQAHNNNDRMTFVFVAGPEGTGHHTLEEIAGVIQKYYQRTNVNSTQKTVVDLRPSLQPVHFDKVYPAGTQAQKFFAKFSLDKVRKELSNYGAIKKLQSNKGVRKIFFDSQEAYPFGSDDMHRYADLVHLKNLHDEGVFDLKVILLSRDPTNATLSNNRRMFHSNAPVERQCRTMENAMTYLSSVASTLPCNSLMLWPFEFFVSDPKTSLAALADFLDLDQGVFDGQQGEAIASVAQGSGNKASNFSPLGGRQNHTYKRAYVKSQTCNEILPEGEALTPKCEEVARTALGDFFRKRTGQWPMLRPPV